MPFWWLSVVFDASIRDSTKLLYKSLLDVLSVNPWEIPVAPGKNSRVPAGSPGRLHPCCRTMAGPVNTWKRCVRESTPTRWSLFSVCLPCPKPAAASLAPEQTGAIFLPLPHIYFGLTCSLTLWLMWLSIECGDFQISASGLKSNCPEKTKTQRMMFKFWILFTNKLLLGFLLPWDTIAAMAADDWTHSPVTCLSGSKILRALGYAM